MGAIAEFESLTADLGDILLDSGQLQREARIRVTNRGSGPLRFTQLTLSCGCLSARVDEPEIAPGAHGTLIIHADLSEAGERDVTVRAHSNCQLQSVHVVRVRWNGIPPVQCEPDEVTFGRLLAGETRHADVTIIPSVTNGCDAFEVAPMAAQHAHTLTAELSGRRLRLTLSAGPEPGDFTQPVTLQVRNCWMESISIPVRWSVVRKVSVSPAVLFFGSVAPGETHSRQIVVQAHETDALRTQDGSDAGRLAESVAIHWTKQEDRIWIGDVAVTAPSRPGAFHQTIHLPIGDPQDDGPRLVVSGFVKTPGDR